MWIDAQNTCTEIGGDGDSCRLCQNEMDQFCRVVKTMFFFNGCRFGIGVYLHVALDRNRAEMA